MELPATGGAWLGRNFCLGVAGNSGIIMEIGGYLPENPGEMPLKI
jgi:hypothetical protein